MKTLVLAVDPQKPDPKKITRAAALLAAGELVAFPTETVYGLGVNALDPQAIAKVYKAKERPQDNPLIVHVADQKDVRPLVKRVPAAAKLLMDNFWPGPLSIVFPKKDVVPDATTAGLDTVVIRMPSHPVALALIEAAGKPIAAPSANRSGRPSPTTAQHVLEDMNGRIACVVDAGHTQVGVESTVVDVRTKPVTILRLGGVSIELLRRVIGEVQFHGSGEHIRSPGMKYKHYAPKAKLILVEGKAVDVAASLRQLKRRYAKQGRVTVLKKEDLKPSALYDALRKFKKNEIVLVGSIPQTGSGRVVMDRLRKAASEIIRV